MPDYSPQVVRNGKLPSRSGLVDIHLEDGEIVEIRNSTSDDTGTSETIDDTTIDAGGGLLSPGFVDGHMHLDMAYASESCPLDWNDDGLDADRFHSLMNEYYAEHSTKQLADAAERAIREAVSNGTTYIRTHAMVDLDPGVDTLRALLKAKEATSHLVDVQIVPYASRGILADRNEQLVREALELGLDEIGTESILLGGMDPAGRNRAVEPTLDRWFEVATEYDVDIDVHLQDGGTAGAYVFEQLFQRIDQYDYEGRVTASHGFCLGHVPEWRAVELGEGLAAAEVGLLTCYTSTPVKMPLRALDETGVSIGVGTDNTHDFGFPHGAPDLLLGAFVQLVKLRGSPVEDADYAWYDTNPGLQLLWKLLTRGGASVLDVDSYGLDVGTPATFVVLDRSTPEEAITRRATPKYVFKDGQLVAEDGEVVA